MCSVFFPKETPWLRDLEDELFAFPNDRHDDQVDSISQALGHKITSLWTKESLDGYITSLTALARMHCRPTQVRWDARKRSAQSTLKREAVQPKIDLHREPRVLDRIMQIASTCELDVAADRTQGSAAAEVERAVSLHGAIDRAGQRARQEAPYVGSMHCERVLQAQSRIREAMDVFSAMAICPARIEHQV